MTEWLLQQLQETAQDFTKPFEVGDTVHVLGKLTDYREDLEICIYDFSMSFNVYFTINITIES